ncbi:MAG: MFS transporter [Acidocella sp.]|nr:MFS transporter [Acidocella sp.]
MNRARLFIAIAGAFLSAASFWMSLPLIAVSLRRDGVSDLWVGLISGLPWVGLLTVLPLVPRLIRRIGLQRTVLSGMLISILVFVGFASTRSVVIWSVLFCIQGATLGLRWAAMDTWINGAVPDHARGRLVGLYELVASGSIAAGPACLVFLGNSGSLPFIFCAAIVTLASVLLLIAGRETAIKVRAKIQLSVWRILSLERAAFVAIALVGVTEACNLSLLPLFALGSGASASAASMYLVIMQGAGAAGAFLFGFLADKFNRPAILLGTGFITIAAPLALPLLYPSLFLWPLLLAWGLAIGGMFTLGMIVLGARFKGNALASAVALSVAVYTIGGILGPPAMGALMARFGAFGLPYGLAAIALLSVASAACFEVLRPHMVIAP